MRLRLVAFATLALAGCGAAHLSDDSDVPGVSPGTVTLRLLLPATESFCDVVSGCAGVSHVSFLTQSGQSLERGPRYCGTQCSTCAALPCPAIPACIPLPDAVPITEVEVTWDGSYVESGVCGNSVACSAAKFVARGRYVARMCATPGTVGARTGSDTGTMCTPTGPTQCVDVPFDIPSSSPVEATLPAPLPVP